MQHKLAPLFCRPWMLNGISPRLIESHYEVNYGGALTRLNALAKELDGLDPATARPEAIRRLKRDEATALNATLLHELYFASLGGDGRKQPGEIAEALARDFGSVDHWRQEFVALARAMSEGAGWVLLTYVPRSQRLINHAAADDGEAIAGAIPILALDMYEHAYHIDFGANAEAYIAAFMRNIDWNTVQKRLQIARGVEPPPQLRQEQFADVPAVSVEEVKAMVAAGEKVQIIDTRPRHYITRAHDIMAGAVWRDPERLEDWVGELSKTEPVITFCVYGFHIGCETAAMLRKAGYDARYMAGGHYAWKAIGGAMQRLDPPKG